MHKNDGGRHYTKMKTKQKCLRHSCAPLQKIFDFEMAYFGGFWGAKFQVFLYNRKL